MSPPVLELASEQRRRKVGTATLDKPEVEPETEDAGGAVDVGGQGPPPLLPPTLPRRPERPPQWMRLLCYGAVLILAFAAGYGIGIVWRHVDRAAWG